MERKILIVAATKYEVNPLLQHFGLVDQNFIEQPTFDVLITGVGMVATAFALGQRLSPQTYKLVLNVGIAGSFNQKIALGSLVSVQSDCFSELGAQDHDNFLTINQLGFGSNTAFATAEVGNFQKLKGITVNTVHGNAASITATQSRFAADVESMEGASVFFACGQLGIPCAQVRSISNYVTPRNKDDWKITLAIENLNAWLIAYLESNQHNA